MTTIQYEPVFGLNRENLEKILNISEKDLATKFNVGINAIQKIKHNRTWKQIEV